jgi:N-acyl homoserine lactone hydrolase
MRGRKSARPAWLGLVVHFAMIAQPGKAAEVSPEIRLYTLECGHYAQYDMSILSDTGEYDGKTGSLADPCFLIVHPKGILLWDTGGADPVERIPAGTDVHSTPRPLAITLVSQLRVLNLTPSDITYVAFSHFHGDHVGNAKSFRSATWIINRAELEWMLRNPAGSTDPAFIDALKHHVKKKILDTYYDPADYDVFGDQSVKILFTPGHTPGSQSLEVRLKQSGPVILTGDLYQTSDNRKYRRVPTENTSRAESLASMDRIAEITRQTGAKVVVQMSENEFDALPRFPAFLD